MTIQHYALGGPIFSFRPWCGTLFTSDAKPKNFLKQYSDVFNAVEGNSTFYGLPKAETIERWREETPDNFRFCFKFPRTISHEKRLLHTERETEQFLTLLQPLGSRLGPLFLQLSPNFSGRELDNLIQFVEKLPSGFEYAVEVRHLDYFDFGDHETALDDFLADKEIDRVLFDSRGVHRARHRDEDTLQAQQRKPKVPARFVATGPHPFVRFIAHPDLDENNESLQHWAEVFANWIDEGRYPYMFVHLPGDVLVPQLARRFHHMLQQKLPVGDLPPWPGETHIAPQEQLQLF